MAGSRDNGGWKVRGVSVTGYSHLRDGVSCQDAYRHRYEPSSGAYVLAVADGAGSRPRSAEGAALAVGLAVEELSARLAAGGLPEAPDAWIALLRTAFSAVVKSFRDTTRRIGGSPAEFASTLTVAVLAVPWLGIISLGDGIVVTGAERVEDESGLHLVTTASPAGEYVNETCFLSSEGALDQVTIQCVHDPGLLALLLGTDGVVPLAVLRDGPSGRPNRTFIEPILGWLTAARSDPAEVSRLLHEERLTRLSADDKTLLAAVRT